MRFYVAVINRTNCHTITDAATDVPSQHVSRTDKPAEGLSGVLSEPFGNMVKADGSAPPIERSGAAVGRIKGSGGRGCLVDDAGPEAQAQEVQARQMTSLPGLDAVFLRQTTGAVPHGPA